MPTATTPKNSTSRWATLPAVSTYPLPITGTTPEPDTSTTVRITAEVGATPWETDFYEAGGFAVCDVSLEASKEIRITRSFSLPLFAKVTWNPCSERAYFVAGFGF